MTVPTVPWQNPGQGTINFPRVVNPYTGVWWSTQTVTGVPENIMGWHLAQGFEVTGVSQDNTTTPPTNTFALTKEGMKPLQVLLSLCNSYTTAANEARDANTFRYNQLVSNWNEMVSSSQTQFEAQTNEQNVQAGVYLGDLGTYMSAVEALINENRTQMVIDAQAANVAIGEMNTKLAELENNAQSNAVTIGTLLTAQAGYLSTFLNDFSGKLNDLDSNFTAHLAAVVADLGSLDTITENHITAYSAQFATLYSDYIDHSSTLDILLAESTTNTNTFVTDIGVLLDLLLADYTAIAISLNVYIADAGTLVDGHVTDYNAVLDLLESDYINHSITATGFLTGLGATELARINELFAATLSVQLQDLIDRGLYTSVIVTDITARNARDRDEQIQMLNDRLNREKFENQHQLYGQQSSMRGRLLDGKDRLHTVQQEVLRYQAAQVSGIYALLQDTRNRTIQGKQSILSAQDANTRLGIEVQSGLYAKLQDVRMKIIASTDRIYQIRDALSKYETGEEHRLFEQLQQIEGQHLAGIDKQHSEKQDVSKIAMSERDALLGQLQAAVQGILSGKERYSSILMQNAATLASHKSKAIAEQMNTSVARLEGWKTISDQNRQLMAYQLDERNKLIIGLYSLVERRDDIGPEWTNLANLLSAVGEGGWTSPG